MGPCPLAQPTVFTTNITNIVGHPVRRFEYVRIRYSDDADAAIFLSDLIKILALLNPSPSVFVSDLGDSWVNHRQNLPVVNGLIKAESVEYKKTLRNGIEPFTAAYSSYQSDPKSP